jgi:hypothetical protein
MDRRQRGKQQAGIPWTHFCDNLFALIKVSDQAISQRRFQTGRNKTQLSASNGCLLPGRQEAMGWMRYIGVLIGTKMVFNWEDAYQQYRGTFDYPRNPSLRQHLLRQARTVLANCKLEDVQWLIIALQHSEPERRWFVARAFVNAAQMPWRLFHLMLRAALFEDASSNRLFIEPCIRAFGAEKVRTALELIGNNGSDAEKAGVMKAWYWVRA